MKKAHLTKVALIMSVFCFFKMTMAFSYQQAQQPFSMFYQQPICQYLVYSYIEENEVKPIAQESLPLIYYFHESVSREHKPIIYDQVEAWNNITGNEVVRINSEIEYGAFDPRTDNPDQKNVIYLIDEEDYARVLNSSGNDTIKGTSDIFLPGMSRIAISTTNNDQDASLYITGSDILIREEVLTDISFYRYQLLIDMRNLGIEKDFSNESIEVIRDAIVDYMTNVSDEDLKAGLVRDIYRATAIQNPNPDSSQLDEINAYVESFTDERLRGIRTDAMNNLLSIDISSQDSIVLQNTIRREMGHGLGLGSYMLPDGHPMRDLNIMSPYRGAQAYNQRVLKEIDLFAVQGIRCLYRGYPNFTRY